MNSNNVQPNGRDAAPPPAHPINSTYPARRLRRPKGWLQDLICCSTVKYIELHDGRTYAIYEDGFRGLCNWTVGDFDTFSRDPDFEEIPVPENKIGLRGFAKSDTYAERGTPLVIQSYREGVYRLGRDEAYSAYSDFMVAEKYLDCYFTTDKLDTYVGRSGYWKSPLGEAKIGDPVKITGRLPSGWFVTDRPGWLGTGLEIAPHEIDLFFTEANPAPARKFKPSTFATHYAVNDTLYRTEAEAVSAATEAARGSIGPVIVYRAVKQVSVELEEKITITEAR